MESISRDPLNQDLAICFDLICFIRGSLANVMKAEAQRVVVHRSTPSLQEEGWTSLLHVGKWVSVTQADIDIKPASRYVKTPQSK